ncbi:hypothetical protein Tco_0854200 [Tanacetum coccineum]
MSNSDELRHTDNTTLDTSQTPRHTPPGVSQETSYSRITYLAIHPVLHHLTSSPSSRMAAYQRMFLKQDPTGVKSSNCLLERMDEARQKWHPEDAMLFFRNPPVNRSTNRNNVDINSGIDTQMLDQLIATRVAEALAAAAVTYAASTQEETKPRI